MKTIQRATIIAMLGLSGFAHAQRTYDFDPDELEDDTKWREVATKLPPYPKPENAREYDPGPTSDNRAFIDMVSLGQGKDGVVRLALVVKSPQGALNVTFEGFRCRTGERKTYGYGRKDGTWSQARNAQWVKTFSNNAQPHYTVLARDFLCVDKDTAVTFNTVLTRINRGTKVVSDAPF